MVTLISTPPPPHPLFFSCEPSLTITSALLFYNIGILSDMFAFYLIK